MIKLKENSLHAKLYKWFYETSTLPKNICKYFWSSVFAILFSLIYALPGDLYNMISRNEKNRFAGFSIFWASSFLLYCICVAAYQMIYLNGMQEFDGIIAFIGGLCIATISMMILGFLSLAIFYYLIGMPVTYLYKCYLNLEKPRIKIKCKCKYLDKLIKKYCSLIKWEK